MHSLLEQQLKKFLGKPAADSKLQNFLEAVSITYESYEQDSQSRQQACTRQIRELTDANQKLQEEAATANARFKELENIKMAMLNLLEDERSLEDSLREERDRIKAIIASVGEGLIVVDRYFQIMLINPIAQKELGVTASEAVGRDVREVITSFYGAQPIPDRERPISIAIKTGQIVDISMSENMYFQTLSGRRFPVTLAVTPLRGEDAKNTIGLVIVFRNITEEKKFDDAKSSFISIASHQLRTPLTPLRWFSEMLLQGDAGPLNDKQKDLLTDIHKSVDRMIALINLLLQIARIETGRVKIQPQPLDLAQISQELITALHTVLNNKNQQVTVTSSPEKLPLIPMDKDVLWQVIQNLLTNASRYSPAGSSIEIRIVQQDPLVRYSITDHGIGIPKDQQGRIFEKFYRAPNAFKLVPEGTGLGLALVKSLVNEWDGKVWFETEEGKGTTFFFTVPLTGMKAREGEVTLAV